MPLDGAGYPTNCGDDTEPACDVLLQGTLQITSCKTGLAEHAGQCVAIDADGYPVTCGDGGEPACDAGLQFTLTINACKSGNAEYPPSQCLALDADGFPPDCGDGGEPACNVAQQTAIGIGSCKSNATEHPLGQCLALDADGYPVTCGDSGEPACDLTLQTALLITSCKTNLAEYGGQCVDIDADGYPVTCGDGGEPACPITLQTTLLITACKLGNGEYPPGQCLALDPDGYPPTCGDRFEAACTLDVQAALLITACKSGLVDDAGTCKHPDDLFPSHCGGPGQPSCTVLEHVPSCKSGLIDSRGFCVQQDADGFPSNCGDEFEAPCPITAHIPSCKSGLSERDGLCKGLPADCGRVDQRACTIFENLFPCQPGLYNSFGTCVATDGEGYPTNCGDPDEPACLIDLQLTLGVTSCKPGVHEIQGICVSAEFCGHDGQVGCPVPPTCGPGLAQDNLAVCVPCGVAGGPACQTGAACGDRLNDVERFCEPCGGPGQPVCETGALCTGDRLNAVGGVCQSCGSFTNPLCTSGAACEAGFEAIGSLCVSIRQGNYIVELDFASAGESIWKPGVAPDIEKLEVTVIDESWELSHREQGSFTVAETTFGGAVEASAIAAAGLGWSLEFDTGSVDVTYPVRVGLQVPAAKAFGPGEIFTITSTADLMPGWDVAAQPVGVNMSAKVKAALTATADLELSAFGEICEVPLFPQFGIPLIEETLAVGDEREESLNFFGIDVLPYEFTETQELKYGVSGTLDVPQVTPTASVDVGADKRLKPIVARGEHNFVDIAFNLINYLEKALTGGASAKVPETDPPPGSKKVAHPQLPDIPINFGSSTLIPLDGELDLGGGATASWAIVEGKVDFDLTASQDLVFDPVVDITLRFDEPVAFVVTREGAIVQTGLSPSVTYEAGDTISLTYPADRLTPMNVVPSFALRNSFTNDTALTLGGGLRTRANEYELHIPGFDLTPAVDATCTPEAIEPACVTICGIEFCSPRVEFPPICIPDIPGVSTPPVNFHIGPQFAFSPNISHRVGFDVIDGTWQMAGFDSFTTAPFALVPRDDTPPVVTSTITGTLGDNGWHTSDVRVRWNVSDPESAIDSSTGCDAVDVTTDTAGTTVTCEATSEGGTTSESVTIKRDATPPLVSSSLSDTPNGDGWHNASVSVSFSASDALAGLADASPTTDVVISDEASAQEASATFTDLAGNSTTATFPGLNLDLTPPTAVYNGPQEIEEGDAITLDGSGSSDLLSGIASIAWDTDGDGLFDDPDTFSRARGPDSVTVAMRVTDRAGNHADTSATITIENVAPTVDAGAAETLDEGDNLARAGSFTDPGADTWTATVDYGTGEGSEPLALTGQTFSLSHAYPEDGTYTVAVSLDDGTGPVSDSFAVTVDNVVPDVAAGGDATVDEGSALARAGSFTDPGTDTWTASVDYGDGSGNAPLALNGQTFVLDHAYADDGQYVVTVRVADGETTGGTATFDVTVVNLPPVVTAAETGAADEGRPVTLELASFTDAGRSDTHTATIDWGDNRQETFAVTQEDGAGTVVAEHSYADDGDYAVTVTVTDDGGKAGTATTAVTVINLPPVLTAAGHGAADEGTPVSLELATFTDAGRSDTHTATIDWGDNRQETFAVTQENGTGSVVGEHSYADNGDYTVTITVTDDDGASDDATLMVSVANVSPTIVGPANVPPVDEGSVFAGSGSFTDPGADTWTATVDYGDGAGPQPLELSGQTFTLSHAYANDGQYDVTVRVADGVTTGGDATFGVTVDNVAPALTLGTVASIDEGDILQASGSFFDPGQDHWTATVDYGDGGGPLPLELDGQTFVLGHSYVQSGAYTVTVTVDDGSGAGMADTALTVVNLPPVVTAAGPGSGDEGAPLELELATFTDAGVADTHTATIDWGDNRQDSLAVTQQDGAGPVAAQHTYADDGDYTVTVRVTDDDGASDDATLTVSVANVSPTIVVPANVPPVDEGSVFAGNGSFTDPGTDVWTATVDYGDGTVAQTLPLSDQTYSLSHQYTDDGSYTVTVTVHDGPTSQGAASFGVTVDNVAPSVDMAAGATPVDEGASFTTTGSFTDPGTDTWTATVDYGDQTGPQPLDLDADNRFALEHVYADDDEYTVTVRVTDDDDGVGADEVLITVANVAPQVTPKAAPVADEGRELTFALASFTDGGSADTHTATVDWGDEVTDPAVVNTETITGSHVYADNGTYEVTVTVRDDDGGEDSATLTLEVDNLPPTVTLFDATPDPVDEGAATMLGLAFTDPGSADTHEAIWTFGDGTTFTDDVTAGERPFHLSQRYDDDGAYTVELTVRDDDGGETTAELTLDVLNVAPAFEPALADQTVHEGGALSLAVTATDGSPTDVLTLTADGLPPGAHFLEASQPAPATATLSWMPACDRAGEYPVTLTVRDDDGQTVERTITLTVTEACAAVVAVTSEKDDTVTIIDAETHQIVDVEPIGRQPAGVAFFDLTNGGAGLPSELFVGDRGVRRGVRHGHGDDDDDDDSDDDSDDDRGGRGAVRVLRGPFPPAPDTAGMFTLFNTIEMGPRPEGVAMTPDGSQVWVVEGKDDAVWIFDRASETVVGTLPLRVPRLTRRGRVRGWRTVGKEPLALSFSPDGAWAYVIARGSGTLVTIDRDAATADPAAAITGVVSIGKRPMASAPNRLGSLLYVASENGIAVIDTSVSDTPRLLGHMPVELPRAPRDRKRRGDDDDDDDGGGRRGRKIAPGGLALVPSANRLYVTDTRSDRVVVLSVEPAPAYLGVVGTIDVGRDPRGIAATRPGSFQDEAYLYVTNRRDHTMSIIEVSSNRVIAVVPVGRRPKAVAAGIVPTSP